MGTYLHVGSPTSISCGEVLSTVLFLDIKVKEQSIENLMRFVQLQVVLIVFDYVWFSVSGGIRFLNLHVT